MTLAAAIQMMGTTCNVPTESNAGLVQSVAVAQQASINAAAQGARPRNLPAKQRISTATGLGGDIAMRPISALLELALGTSLQQDPATAAFARRWAILRHLGIYRRSARYGRLQLDRAAIAPIGPNQRRVLSEEIGIGFGIVAAKHWCRTRNPGTGTISAIDFDTALHNGSINRFNIGDRQPDYILKYTDPQRPHVDIYELLEVKGTTSRGYAVTQLGRASTQLASVTASGAAVTGLATSTVSNSGGIRVLAVDPEQSPIRYALSSEVAQEWRNKPPKKRPDSPIEDVLVPELAAKSTNADFASLAAFAGLTQLSKSWHQYGSKSRQVGKADHAEIRIGSMTFHGTQTEISLPGTPGHLTIFEGIDAEVHERLESISPTATSEAQHRFWALRGKEIEKLERESMSGRDGRAAAFSSSGAVLSIRVE